jgi:ribonucleoside-triphosphate reductase
MCKCGQVTEVYSRVCGYFRPTTSWNLGKVEEFRNRKAYNVRQAVSQVNLENEEISKKVVENA